MPQRAVARHCARAGLPEHAIADRLGPDKRAPLRDSRATPYGGSERSEAVGEAGLTPASLLLDPASLLAIRVVSGGGGI
jgi:hypothetical protein